MQFDIFISHASEDKDTVARSLARGLVARGLKVWFDESALMLGDSLPQTIDRGLAQSSWGVVILSPAFFAKNWPQRELDALAAREVRDGRKVILPIWHNVDERYVAQLSPTLASRLAIRSSHGEDAIVEAILLAMSVDVAHAPRVIVPQQPDPFRRNPDGSYSYSVYVRGFRDDKDQFTQRLVKDFDVRGIASVTEEETGWTQISFRYDGPHPPERIELLAMKHGLQVTTTAVAENE